MAVIHAMHGYMGGGKTTFSKKLEIDLNAIRFSPDEWMYHFYGKNPQGVSFDDCSQRIEKMIFDLSAKILGCDIDVVLDFGFWRRKGRDDLRSFAHQYGVDLIIYQFDVSYDEGKRRVLARTKSNRHGELWIDESAYDMLYTHFEPIQDDEKALTQIIIKS